MKKKHIKNILFLNPAEADISLVKSIGEKGIFELNLLCKDSTPEGLVKDNIKILDHTGEDEFDIVFSHTQDLINDDFQEIFNKTSLLIVLGYSPLAFSTLLNFENFTFNTRMIGARIFETSGEIDILELVNLPTTSQKTLNLLISWSQEIGVNISLLQYDIAGGGAERIRVPFESEVWKMVREGITSPQELNTLSRENLGFTLGVLDAIRSRNPNLRSRIAKQVFITSMNDGRFRPEYDQFPPDITGTWDKMVETRESFEDQESGITPENILVIGTPHIVELWCEKIYKQTRTTVMPKAVKLWDMGGYSEELQKEIQDHGPYDLIIEVLIAPTEERQRLLEQLIGSVKETTQFWVHTLNTPATVTVQVIPEQLTAVGFSGIPGINDSVFCEMSKPKNSSHSEFNKALKTAVSLGFKPVEVADEPGGVIPRLLATMVNATSFLAREGVVTSEVEADRIAAKALNIANGPLALADVYGLDTIEAVLIGLYAFNGQDRYRISPLITMRIESGALGNVTDKGYYRL